MSPKEVLNSISVARINPEKDARTEKSSQMEALEYYEYSSKRDDPGTEAVLGQLNYFGPGGNAPNYAVALEHFRRAARYGNDAAQAYLGQMYYRGEGVLRDLKVAFEYFEAAVKGANNPLALNGLGLMYWRGEGPDGRVNLDEAERYLKAAVTANYPESFYNLAMVLKDVSPLVNSDRIFQNLMNAVRNGYVLANLELAKRFLVSENTCNLAVYVKEAEFYFTFNSLVFVDVEGVGGAFKDCGNVQSGL